MPQVIVDREVGCLKPNYSLKFDLPKVPAIGSYLSIQRPNKPEPYGKDLVVRQAWWRLKHPETEGSCESGREKTGGVTEIFVECDPARHLLWWR
ncbi:hypothetical protein Aam_096_033 [Acidocella aminolytica 101 = DSM 11237]|uniref:Uncharacterized protein n=2 Tax=Acidocella TaxID=50709 RepID=A0A0D6PL34_9PROT|nr:hypothetical protein Aam_096_033 [Acidocella aminolytica 101 = DSM 11237]